MDVKMDDNKGGRFARIGCVAFYFVLACGIGWRGFNYNNDSDPHPELPVFLCASTAIILLMLCFITLAGRREAGPS